MNHSFSKGGYLGGRDLLLVIIVILLIFQNPPAPKSASSDDPPGSMIAEIGWPDGNPADVDLWVYSEGEERPVGFSNRSGKFWSLLRDDLGSRNDTLPINAEHAYARDVKAGRYVFNVMCYTCRAGAVTVGFEVRVIMNGVARTLLTTKITLQKNGQELTVVSFDLTDKGAIVPGSSHNVFFPMYKAWK